MIKGTQRMNINLKNVSLIFLLIIFSLSAFSCISTRPGPLMMNHVKMQKYSEALQVMRDEIKNPQNNSDQYLASIYCQALYALYHYAGSHGVESGMDDEAQLYYQKGMAYATNDKYRQYLINNAMQNYYSWTQRNGITIPYIKEQIKYAEKIMTYIQFF